MRVLRILLVVWAMTASVGVASAEAVPDGCDHAGMIARDGADKTMPMPMAMAHGGDETHHDCGSDCGASSGCDGACACDGAFGPAALTVRATSAEAYPVADDRTRPVATSGLAFFMPIEGPPPRLL